jgi:recombination protein RecT
MTITPSTASTDGLRNRVAERQTGTGSEVTKASGPPATLGALVQQMRPELARALPKHMDADRLARITLTVLRRTPALNRCSPESFAGALMTCAQLGLEPGPTGEAYLVPYGTECTLIIGYRGMIKLYWQSPLAKSIDAQVVYEHDEFDYAYGLQPFLVHKPRLNDRGSAIAYYCAVTLANGGQAFVVLSRDDVEKIRKRSKAKDSGPWSTDYEAMAKKTCVRQLFRMLPTSTELGQAMTQDETVRRDRDLDALDIPGDHLVEPEVVPKAVDTGTGEVLPASTGEWPSAAQPGSKAAG